MNQVIIYFTGEEMDSLYSAYVYGRVDGESLEEYLHRSIITAAKLSKELRGKVIQCF